VYLKQQLPQRTNQRSSRLPDGQQESLGTQLPEMANKPSERVLEL
jgi:hypothetical protein